jgi:deoxyadenosine/deoxycytidine kinase
LFKPLIVGDYFLSKSLIFAKATLKGDELNLFMQLYDIMQPNLPQPDLLVYLYLDTKSLQANIRKRGRTYEQKIPDAYLEQVQESYFDFIRTRTELRVLMLNTAGADFVNNPADFDQICGLLERDYPKGLTRISLKED